MWAVECFLAHTVVPETIASMQHTSHATFHTAHDKIDMSHGTLRGS